jgi:hypothetical protein
MGMNDAALSAAGTRSKAVWLTDPPEPIPAYTEATRYRPAPARVQAALAQANKVLAAAHKSAAMTRKARRYVPAVRKLQAAVRIAAETGHRRCAASSSTSGSDPGRESDQPERQ